jgi:hypothetical protein
MRASWKKATTIIEDLFTLPCDSHGIQLVVKDLLERPTIEHAWKEASQIVNSIRNSPKQQSFLWQEMERLYKGGKRVLIASVITR